MISVLLALRQYEFQQRIIDVFDMNITSPIGIALIGAGMIAKTHVSALASIPTRARLVSIVSRRPERADYLAAYYPDPPPNFTSDLSTVIENPEIRIAIVATPPDVRIELIRSLAQAGKHILLEKPVARNVDEALEVVEICERAGVHLGVVFQHRMWPSSKAAVQLMTSGRLGKLGHVETYARDGGGVMITQAIHTIDLALSLTGPVTRVQAMTATTPLHQMESEDFAVAGLHFSCGAVGSLVVSTASYPQSPETITLHCENGSTKHAWHQAIIEDFIESIQQDRVPTISGRTGLESQRLIEAIEASSRSGAAAVITP